jgi:hypothetical protein
MSAEIDMKEVKRKVDRSFFRDGLFEIYLGLGFLFAGLWVVTRKPVFLFFPGPLAVLFSLGKTYISTPRQGYFKPLKPSREKIKNTAAMVSIPVLIVAISIILLATGVYPDGSRDILGKSVVVICAISVFAGFIHIARTKHFKRFYLYAVLTLMAFIEGPFFDSGYSWFTFSAILVLMGTWILMCFLHEYPRPDKEVSHDQAHR